MDKNNLEELRKLVEAVIYAPTKKEAKDPIKRLEFMASQMKSSLDGYLSGKLKKVVNYAIEASGQVKNKEHWISNMEESWYILKSEIKDNQ